MTQMRLLISSILLLGGLLQAQNIPQTCPERKLCTLQLQDETVLLGRVKSYEVQQADTTLKLISPQGLMQIPLRNVLRVWGEESPQTQHIAEYSDAISEETKQKLLTTSDFERVEKPNNGVGKLFANVILPSDLKRHIEFGVTNEQVPPFDFQRQETLQLNNATLIAYLLYPFCFTLPCNLLAPARETVNIKKIHLQHRFHRGLLGVGLGGGTTPGGTNVFKFDVGGGVELIRLRKLYAEGHLGTGLMNFDAIPRDEKAQERERFLVPHLQAEAQVGFRLERRSSSKNLPFFDLYIRRGALVTFKDGKSSRVATFSKGVRIGFSF